MSNSSNTPALNPLSLAQAMLDALRAQRFELTPDALQGGAPLGQHPSIDLAVAAFPAGAAPVFANVLFSREYPRGLVAQIDESAGPVRNIRYLADVQDEQGNSIAWLPGADWSAIPWRPLAGPADPALPRFVAPYPASLLKLMILVGLGLLVDAGRTDWEARLGQPARALADWAFDMTALSSNEATTLLVAHLHALGAIRREGGREFHNELHDFFENLGLPTLRLANTRPDGGWGNAAGAGVGQIQMTAWDTLRLLWWLDPQAPAPPWLNINNMPCLSDASRCLILHALREQGLHEVLSSGLLAGLPGWVAGIPARLPARWLRHGDGSARVGDRHFPADLLAVNRQAELLFSHKTGNTLNYSADAGLVLGIPPARRHYLIAMVSNLGNRYATDARAATNWRIPALGGAMDAFLRQHLEA
ncbi:hypothetical protein HNP55_001989 [Paucibacter oligotrophus]|uniref:Beta-lactamase family protein n=1 Tax=Roseateles oligotrophus TaxID=1769250 RepID=A0A840L5J3_9BURK|nr:hypothetical protein [Roseateles oligotrophus]MBB4843470.1 hypothetical protein [Roseateles oligotrophus]